MPIKSETEIAGLASLASAGLSLDALVAAIASIGETFHAATGLQPAPYASAFFGRAAVVAPYLEPGRVALVGGRMAMSEQTLAALAARDGHAPAAALPAPPAPPGRRAISVTGRIGEDA